MMDQIMIHDITNSIFNNKQFGDDISENSNGYNNRYNNISKYFNIINNEDFLKFNEISINKNNNQDDYEEQNGVNLTVII